MINWQIMIEPKFKNFYDILRKRLDENYNLTVIERLFFPAPDSSAEETIPDGERLWKSYLKSILPPEFTSLFYLNHRLADNLVNRLLSFNSYTIEHKITKIVEALFFKSISSERRQEFVNQILNFHYRLPKWADGVWHSLILKNRKSAFAGIKKEIFQSRDNWTCASFLSAAGYRYPCSIKSFKAWIKWSGTKIVGDGFGHWIECLKSVASDFNGIYRVDFILNLIFSGRSFLSLPALCRKLSSCHICPLRPDCHYFNNTRNKKIKAGLEDLIRTDDMEEILTWDLIKYLAGDLWNNSEKQRFFLNNLSTPRSDFAPDLNEDDEKFLLFLSGVRELSNRFQHAEKLSKGERLTGSEKIYKHLKHKLSRDQQESFYTLILDNKYRVIRLRLITKGTLNQSPVHPREVFAPAIQLRAAVIVLIHNHPSGDASPSRQDINTTRRLCEVGDIVGIKVLDHVIIGGNKYFSFLDEGLIT